MFPPVLPHYLAREIEPQAAQQIAVRPSVLFSSPDPQLWVSTILSDHSRIRWEGQDIDFERRNPIFSKCVAIKMGLNLTY
jgi:hypothetical protein